MLDTNLENCWICENWVETEFGINLIQIYDEEFGEEVEMVDDPETVYEVFIHFDFDDYNADQMVDQREVNAALKGVFKLDRMIP